MKIIGARPVSFPHFWCSTSGTSHSSVASSNVFEDICHDKDLLVVEATWKSFRFAASPLPLPILPKLLATTQVPSASTDLHKSDPGPKDWMPWRTLLEEKQIFGCQSAGAQCVSNKNSEGR